MHFTALYIFTIMEHKYYCIVSNEWFLTYLLLSDEWKLHLF